MRHTVPAAFLDHSDPRALIRALQPELGEASDEQITRVAALVDQMPRRGAADDLMAPLRPRLAQLRVPRVIQFGRLLFLPLDPFDRAGTSLEDRASSHSADGAIGIDPPCPRSDGSGRHWY